MDTKVGGHARRGPAVDFDAFWRCERRRCAPFRVPDEDWQVGVAWRYLDAPDHFRYMMNFGAREYGSV